MSLTARAKALRGVGYSSLLRAAHGLLEIAVQPPAQPPGYGSSWAAGHSHAISRRAHPRRKEPWQLEFERLLKIEQERQAQESAGAAAQAISVPQPATGRVLRARAQREREHAVLCG